MKKKVKCVLLGCADKKFPSAPMLECDDSNLGIFSGSEQKDLFARCFLEQVSTFVYKTQLKI